MKRFLRNFLFTLVLVGVGLIVYNLATYFSEIKYTSFSDSDVTKVESMGLWAKIFGWKDVPDDLVEVDVRENIVIEPVVPPKPEVVHLSTPEPLKAIYMTQCVAGTPSFRDQLIELVDETELNAIMIDVKDFSGRLGFVTDNPILADSVSDECRASDMKDLVKRLHEKDIYVMARITVFQDPYYTKVRPDLAVKRLDNGGTWTDHKGLAFIDVGAKDYWDYIVEISKEAHAIGFDELNYDYVRFPSDGNMQNVSYTHSGNISKEEALEKFFAYLYQEMSDPENYEGDTRPKLSADLFGYTTTNFDDLGIGQLLERSLPYFDYIMPMVYPSHYNSGFIGIADPAAYPYEVVKYSMDRGADRAGMMQMSKNSTGTSTQEVYLRKQAQKGHGDIKASQLRPWLQDFNLGATYTPEMVRKQIQATYDAGLTSWTLWDAANTYTRAALLESNVAADE